MVLDTSLQNTLHYELHIKGKVEQTSERSSALSSTTIANFIWLITKDYY